MLSTTQTQAAKTSTSMFAMPISTALAKVNQLDFTPINMKLQTTDPQKWSTETLQTAEVTYRRFLAIHMVHPSEGFVPNDLLDEYWHQHILDTRKYVQDCGFLFGGLLDHDPYFGLRSEEEKLENLANFEKLKSLWDGYFGEPLLGSANPCSSTDCR